MRARSLALVGVLFVALAAAGAMPLSPKLQAALLAKVFAYDGKLAAIQDRALRVLVVYRNASAEVKAMLDALRDVQLDASAVGVDEVGARIAGADVLYLMPDVNAAQLSVLSAQAGTLSVSGSSGFCDAGQVTVGLGLNDNGRPQIVVNLAQLQREGHRFEPQFLKLTRIVR